MATPDVFLSYNSRDRIVVEQIARRLLSFGLTPWLDIWNLVPGETWQDAIETALRSCSSCAVLIGADGLGPWNNAEMRAALSLRIRDKGNGLRVIPVLLPGSSRSFYEALPDFLQQFTLVDLSVSIEDDDSFKRLVCGICGVPPGPTGIKSNAHRSICPYKGLEVFDMCDADLYFGREMLKGRLLARFQTVFESRQQVRLVGVLGDSGSGKSSLIRAGLIGDIKQGIFPGSESWPIVILRPGADPLDSIAIALAKCQEKHTSIKEISAMVERMRRSDSVLAEEACRWMNNLRECDQIILFIDQFEEVFTDCNDEEQRAAFISNLVEAATRINGNIQIVLTLRTDFYRFCAEYEELANILSQNHVLVGPMTREEASLAITMPAEMSGCSFDDGLIDQLLNGCEKEVGSLPLLQYALLQLWQLRSGSRLTLRAYNEIGGIEGALQNRAEVLYGSLETVSQKRLCRILFLQLINLDVDGTPTKRRRTLLDLETWMVNKHEWEEASSIISRFAASDGRLITTSAYGDSFELATIEISHEALLRGWSRLVKWIDEDRENIIIERDLRNSADQWHKKFRSPEYLIRGSRLTRSLEWYNMQERNDPFLREFLEESQIQSAEFSRLTDSAVLDYLQTNASRVWSDAQKLSKWISRAKPLIESLPRYQRQRHDYYLAKEKAILGSDGQDQDEDQSFRMNTLLEFTTRLSRFDNSYVRAANHRLRTDNDLARLTITRFATEWDKAVDSVGDRNKCPRYNGLRITPQIGLVPIGLNSQSGLWEFMHIQTGFLPGDNIKSEIEEDHLLGCILVLLPGGQFKMGAVKPTSLSLLDTPNIDPFALEDEGPVNAVKIDPFFIGKHQMTQGQWIVASGYNPSMFTPSRSNDITLRHPVECVGWNECINVLSPLGLTLPSEAQWEYAARGGTSSVWWVGNDESMVNQVAHIMANCHIPVGKLNRPNHFGLHDVLGNVWEWCLDSYELYPSPLASLQSEQVPSNDLKVSRGGSFFNTASFARSSIRYFVSHPDARFNNRGLRVARMLKSEQ